MALPAWVQSIESKPAPQPLLRLQAFVNTWEGDTGLDQLEGSVWLEEAGLLSSGSAVTSQALAATRQVREAIRALLIHNAGGPRPSPEALAPLRVLADRGRLRADLDGDGQVRLATEAGDPASPGSLAFGPLESGLMSLLLVIRDAQQDGSWSRLKACGNEECQWAFFDRSHSRRGTWCDMATCGNRIKNRNLRERRR